MDPGCVAWRVGRIGPRAIYSLWTRGIAHAYIAVSLSQNENG